MTFVATIHYGDGKPAHELSPRQAAEEFARNFEDEPRTLVSHWAVEGSPLTIEFTLAADAATYRASWQGGSPRSGAYRITKMD